MRSVRIAFLLVFLLCLLTAARADWLVRDDDDAARRHLEAQGWERACRYHNIPWSRYRSPRIPNCSSAQAAGMAGATASDDLTTLPGGRAVRTGTVRLARIPNDSSFSSQPFFAAPAPDANINIEAAWDQVTDVPDAIVAVIDSGADVTHPDLANNLWTNQAEAQGTAGKDDDGNGFADDLHGWNTADKNNNLADDAGHGTTVCGIIGAEGNNGLGVAGVCWRARLLVLKAFSGMYTDMGNVLDAMDYAIDTPGVRIINASWNISSDNEALHDMVRAAGEKGILVITAAGNYGDGSLVKGGDLKDTPVYPAAWSDENIISVASINGQGGLSDFSNYGDAVTVAAPGEPVYSTAPGGSYDSDYGTSFAAPMVSGAVALLLTLHPDLTPAAVRQRLVYTSRHTASLGGIALQGGLLDVHALLLGAPNAVPPAAWTLYQ